MTGSATKQSILFCGAMDCFAALAMTRTGGSWVANDGRFDDDAAK
jgi:hypothetical protein